MAREAKIIISATDKSPEGINDAIKNFERMGYKAKKVSDDTNKSIIQMAKESKAQLEGINAALQLGGWLLMAQKVGQAIGNITKEARENSAAFKDASSTFDSLRKEMGLGIVEALEPTVSWIGKIAARWLDASQAMREYKDAQAKLSAGKELTTADRGALASGRLGDVRASIASNIQNTNTANSSEMGKLLEKLREQERALVEEIRGIAQEQRASVQTINDLTTSVEQIAQERQNSANMWKRLAESRTPAASGSGFGVGDMYFRGIGGMASGGIMQEMFASQYAGIAPARAARTLGEAGDTERGGGFGAYAESDTASSFSKILGALAPLAERFMGLFTSIGSITKIMDPLGTILGAMFEVIGPLIDEALAPLVGILVGIGKVLGEFLAPIIKFLGNIIKGVAAAFIMIINGIIGLINKIPGVNLHKLSIGEATADGTAATSTTGGGGGASYTGSQAVTFNFYNQGNVVGKGGLEELADIIDGLIKQKVRYA